MNTNFTLLAKAKHKKKTVNNFLFILMGLLLIFTLNATAQSECNLSYSSSLGYYGGFEAGSNTNGTDNNFGNLIASTSYNYVTSASSGQGDYQILKLNDLTAPKGYNYVSPYTGTYFFATHTSTSSLQAKIWYKTFAVSPGQKIQVSAYVVSLKTDPTAGFPVNIVINDGTSFSPYTFTGLATNPGLPPTGGFLTTPWTKISGLYIVPLSGVTSIEVKIVDPNPGNYLTLGSHFLGLDAICISAAEPGLLPISLNDFTASKQNKVIDLNWQTSIEQNSSYFDVEFSRDGGNFESIGRVKATGSSTTLKNYSLKHLSPVNGLNYYRLKLVDVDGSFKYSAVRTVKFSNSISIAIMPNPTADKVYLTSNEGGTLQSVDLYTISGKLLQHVNNFTLGKSIDLSTYSPSVYILKLIDKNGSTEVIKVVRK